jgi:chemotaxis protein histidine kinase CheA
MSNLSLKDLCDKCDVKCSKCLDTGKVWRPREHWTAQLDGRGAFDLFRCPRDEGGCSDGHWYSCSHTSDIYEGGIKLFNRDDNSESLRRHYLMDMLTKIELKQQQVREHLENERIKKEQQEQEEKERVERERAERERAEQENCFIIRQNEEKELERQKQIKRDKELKEQEEKEQDEQRKRAQERIRIEQEQADESYKFALIKRKRERIERAMNDNNPQPIWGQSLENSFSTTTTDLHLTIELGKLIEKTTNAIQAYGGDLVSLANSIKDLKIDLEYSSKDEKTEQTKCSQSTTSDGFPIYLFLTISTSKENTICTLLEWCGFNCSETKITIKYMILFPQNNTAKKICDTSVTNVTGSKLTDFVNDMLR